MLTSNHICCIMDKINNSYKIQSNNYELEVTKMEQFSKHLVTQGIHWADYYFRPDLYSAKVFVQPKKEFVRNDVPPLVMDFEHFDKMRSCHCATILEFFVIAENVIEIDGTYKNTKDRSTYPFSAIINDQPYEFSFTILMHYMEKS